MNFSLRPDHYLKNDSGVNGLVMVIRLVTFVVSITVSYYCNKRSVLDSSRVNTGKLKSFEIMYRYLILAIFASKQAAGAVIDLGHGYRNHTYTCWSPEIPFEIYEQITGTSDKWYSTESFSTSEHCGTHLDAPYHFYQQGWKLDEIPLERMVVDGNTRQVVF